MKKILLLPIAIFMIACTEDDVDTSAPEISNLSIFMEEHDHARTADEEDETEIHAGEEATVAADVTDGEGVKSVKVEIHPAFDGHGHSRVADEDDLGWTESFIFDENNTTSLVGTPKNVDFHEHLDIPAYIYAVSTNNKQAGQAWEEGEIVSESDTVMTPEGEYHVVFYAIDINNNQSQEVLTVHMHLEEEE